MDTVQRLIVLLFIFFVGLVRAETVTIDGKTYDRIPAGWLPNGDVTYIGSTPVEACQNFGQAMDASCRQMDVIAGPECRATCTSGFQKSWAIVMGCPSGYTRSGDGAYCLKEITLSPDQVCASLGDLGSAGSKWLYKGSGLSTCRGDCVFIPESSGYDKTTGYTIAWGKLINQGLSCGSTADTESKGYSDSDPDKPVDAPHAGEKGYCPGTYNGATIWVKCSSTNETTKTDNTTTKTETNGGSSTTGTTITSTTSKTSCDGSNCTTTTTTTTTNPDGTKTDKSETTSQAQADYCTRNPNATACKRPEGSFGGSCTAGFSCEGDAVQCAIAREAYRRNCELLEKETPESTLGKNIANGEDRPVGHPGNSPEIVNVSGNINQTNPYGGSCPPDINLNVYGKTVIVPLSNACDIFKWMGYIAVAFTMYAAARITMSGIST